MAVPVVPMPNPWRAMLTLLRAHPDLPAALQGTTPAGRARVCATLPPEFPDELPLLHVNSVPGGRRNVPLRLATTLFDLHVYDVDLFDAMEMARFVAAVVQSIEGKSDDACGFTVVRLVDEPFPLEDPDTRTPRAVIPVSATYRPV